MKIRNIVLIGILGLGLLENVSAGLSDGMVAYYPFNGNANDESGNSNHGTIHEASLTTNRIGTPDTAYHFDGTNDYIEILDNPSINFGSHEFTISFWAKPNSFHDYQRFITKYNQVGGWIIYGDSNSKLYINFSRNSPTAIEIGNYDINSWQLFTLVKNQDNILFYKNDSLLSNQGITTENSDINENIFIGTCGDGCNVPNKFFSGIMDDIRIYNRSLSETEVQQLYYGKVNCFTSTSGTVSPNLDIHVPSLNYQSLIGNQNIWADFGFYGQGANGELLWKLNNFGVNQ